MDKVFDAPFLNITFNAVFFPSIMNLSYCKPKICCRFHQVPINKWNYISSVPWSIANKFCFNNHKRFNCCFFFLLLGCFDFCCPYSHLRQQPLRMLLHPIHDPSVRSALSFVSPPKPRRWQWQWNIYKMQGSIHSFIHSLPLNCNSLLLVEILFILPSQYSLFSL